jgi:hypothetical protein
MVDGPEIVDDMVSIELGEVLISKLAGVVSVFFRNNFCLYLSLYPFCRVLRGYCI